MVKILKVVNDPTAKSVKSSENEEQFMIQIISKYKKEQNIRKECSFK